MLMGNRIPELLDKRGWSVYKLAQVTGLAYGTVHPLGRIEAENKGIPETVYYGTLLKIAQALGVSVDDLED